MNHIKNLAGQTVIYGLSSLVPRFLGYLLNPIYTYNFPSEQYGNVTILYTYIALLNIILTYGMETGFFYFAKKEQDTGKVFGTAFFSVLITTALFIFVAFLNIHFLAKVLQFSGNIRYLFWFIVIIGLDTVSAIPFSRLRYQNKAFKFALIKLISVIVSVLLNIILIWVIPKFLLSKNHLFLGFQYKLDIEFIFISNFIGSLLSIVLLFPEIIKEKLSFSFVLLRQLLIYSLPLMVAGLAGSINDIIDRVLLQFFLPKNYNATSEIGIYWANIKLAVLMTIFIQMFRFAAEPFFFNQNKDADRNLILADVTKYFIIYGLIIFLGVTCYMDLLKYYVGPKEYWAGLKIVPIYLLANLCLGIYFNLTFWFKFSGKTYFGILITGLGALFTILFNIIVIPYMSYFGCSIIRLISYVGMVILAFLLGKKHLDVKYDFKNIFLYIGLALFIFGVTYFLRINNMMLNIFKNTVAFFLFVIYLERRENIISIFIRK